MDTHEDILMALQDPYRGKNEYLNFYWIQETGYLTQALNRGVMWPILKHYTK